MGAAHGVAPRREIRCGLILVGVEEVEHQRGRRGHSLLIHRGAILLRHGGLAPCRSLSLERERYLGGSLLPHGGHRHSGSHTETLYDRHRQLFKLIIHLPVCQANLPVRLFPLD